ncbi:MAG: hypothetical protein ACP5XB_28190 [Isosphaeraceae bacterium]
MRSQKGSRRIVVRDVEYRWRATGNDGYISIGTWPSSNVGPYIHGNLGYHEIWIDQGDGCRSSAGNQIVITNLIIHRIIEHAIAAYGYDPQVQGKDLNLMTLDDVVEWRDAIRSQPGQE